MTEGFISNLKNKYRNIYLVDSMLTWDETLISYDKNLDLVLTLDLELYKFIQNRDGNVHFLDHLVTKERMQKNNFIIYDFFKKWNLDKYGNDTFVFKEVPFGFSLRLEIWNDFVFYIRNYLCLSCLKKINFDNLFCLSKNTVILDILNDLELTFLELNNSQKTGTSFYFPIEQWMDEKIRPKGLRAFLYKVREKVTTFYGTIMPYLDSIISSKSKKIVYIQEYHPTKKILEILREDKNIKVLLSNFSRGSKLKNNLKERLIPIYSSPEKYKEEASSQMRIFDLNKSEKLILDNGIDISEKIYKIIESRISESLPNILRTLDSSIIYLNKNSIDLEILIANIGHHATLLDCVCKSKDIPSYLIINGLLGPEYQDDSKYATFINSYSKSIKEYYFRGMENIVVLGDPRMDMYTLLDMKTNINRVNPTITIGASGFNSVDLNSYVAVEFDFMYDVLSAFSELINSSESINIIIKVRGNGYKKQYEDFVEKFFPLLTIEIIDSTPMKTVLERTDLYVSIYSQTLFEASCLGIPAIYYKKDNEIMDPPFDGKSELVTISSIEELVQAFYDFQSKDERFNKFLDRKIMEKYIGPLDGKNLERNLEFIYGLLNENNKGKAND